MPVNINPWLFSQNNNPAIFGGTLPIPNPGDALFYLDGTLSGSEFVDASGNDRNFTITNKDFTASYFPYKSAATISAPVGDATLIAADINNFLYDSGGDPNAIPVVSFFQNIDYEDKLFSRHVAQVTDANGVETTEPHVKDIVLYSSVLTGADLTTANTYYGVPAMNVAGQWAKLSGNDTTGDGSFANPWLTLSKAETEAGDDGLVYIESGTHDFGGSTLTITCNIKGTGRVEFSNLPASYAFNLSNYFIDIEGLIFSAVGHAGYPFYIHGATSPTIRRCYVSGYKQFWYNPTGAGSATAQFCVCNVVTSSANTFNTLQKGMTIDTCYISDDSPTTCIYNGHSAAASEMLIKNNKVDSDSPSFAYSEYDSAYMKVNGNNFVKAGQIYCDAECAVVEFNSNSGVYDSIDYNTVTSGTFEMHHNNLSINSADQAARAANMDVEMYNNILSITGSGGFWAGTSTIDVTHNFYNNRFEADGDSTAFSVGVGVNANKISGAYYNNVMIQNKSAPSNVHGIQVYDNAGFDIYDNYAEGVRLAFVYKGDNHDYTGACLKYNTVIGGKLLLKGAENLTVIGNTVVNDAVLDTPCIEIITNAIGDAAGNVLKNNILQTALASGTYGLVYIGVGVGVNTIDSNVYYSAGLPIGKVATTTYTWTTWQGLGYEADGINDDPDLNANNVPNPGSPALGGGEALDSAYDDGLDASTDWGDASTVPSVVTKQQTAPWDIGAYVS